jgi:hypothetical protein
VILIAAGLLDVPMWPAASMLMGTNAHRPLAAFAAASALLNLGISVALGTLIAAGLQAVVVVPFAMRRPGCRREPCCRKLWRRTDADERLGLRRAAVGTLELGRARR